MGYLIGAGIILFLFASVFRWQLYMMSHPDEESRIWDDEAGNYPSAYDRRRADGAVSGWKTWQLFLSLWWPLLLFRDTAKLVAFFAKRGKEKVIKRYHKSVEVASDNEVFLAEAVEEVESILHEEVMR